MNWLLCFNSHSVPQPHFLKPAGPSNRLRLGTVSSEYEPHQQGKDSTDVTFGVFILHLCPSAVCSTKTSELEHFAFLAPFGCGAVGMVISWSSYNRQHSNKFIAIKCCTNTCGP